MTAVRILVSGLAGGRARAHLCGARHVGALHHQLAAVLDQQLSVLLMQLVLQRDRPSKDRPRVHQPVPHRCGPAWHACRLVLQGCTSSDISGSKLPEVLPEKSCVHAPFHTRAPTRSSARTWVAQGKAMSTFSSSQGLRLRARWSKGFCWRWVRDWQVAALRGHTCRQCGCTGGCAPQPLGRVHPSDATFPSLFLLLPTDATLCQKQQKDARQDVSFPASPLSHVDGRVALVLRQAGVRVLALHVHAAGGREGVRAGRLEQAGSRRKCLCPAPPSKQPRSAVYCLASPGPCVHH